MCVGAPNAERINADSLCLVGWKRSGLYRNDKLLFGEWNYKMLGRQSEPTHTFDLLFGLGILNLMLGGIVLCSNVRIPLIRLVIPEQPSECPTLGLTEPIYTPRSPKMLPTALVSIGSPVAVPVPWHYD